MTRDEYDQELGRLKADTAALAFKLRLIAMTAGVEVKAYNPNQPRAPKGRTDGGQWVDAGGGSGTATAAKAKKPPRPDASTRTQEIVETLKETPEVDADLETVDIQLDGSVFDEAASEEDQFDVAELGERTIASRLSDIGLVRPPPGQASFVSRAKAYLRDNPEAAIKIAGLARMTLGTTEIVGGVTLIGGGAAASATGAGAVPGAAVMTFGIWNVANGANDVEAGWRMFVTGQPQDSIVNQIVQSFGFSKEVADNVELGFAALTVGGSAAAAKLGQRELAAAAQRGAEIAAAKHLALKPVDVLGNGKSIWSNPDITVRGEMWEIYDAGRTGFPRTPKNFKTFDQFDPKTGTAISNKTLDLTKTTYTKADAGQLARTLKSYGDQVADFKDTKGLLPGKIFKRELRVLLPYGKPTPAQIIQLQTVQKYLAGRGVTLKIFYGL